MNLKLAQLYDLDSGWSRERDFYVQLAGAKPKKILDLGCGTGLICNALADLGHEVTGVDPAESMLQVARLKPNGHKIEWVLSTAQDFKPTKKFDLIIMTGNAFQVLTKENELLATCKTMQQCLTPNGLIAFETRNPHLNWASKWNYELKLKTPSSEVIESRHFDEWVGPIMRFDLKYQFSDQIMTSHSQLRFWTPEEIKNHFLEVGLKVEKLMGDWENEDYNQDTTEEMVFLIRHPEIKFEFFREEHIPILQKWLNQPHVAEFWQETEDESELRKKYLNDLESRGVSAYVIKIGDRPIGYIQSYEAQKVGGGWWPDARQGTYGIDQFIGEPDFINQGWGTKIIQEFVNRLYINHEVTEVITDPELKNSRAIRCYEKVGFVRVGEIQTPGGQALLMKFKR